MTRGTLRILQLGAIAVILAVTPREVFDLDRFLVPKEIVLHATALLAGLFVLRRIALSRLDWLLLTFVGLSALSVVFATNRWIGPRADAQRVGGAAVLDRARAAR